MSDRVYRATAVVGRGVLAALGVRVRVAGAGHLPRTGPVILAANHVSYPDFVLLERAAIERDRCVRFLCRYDAWHVPGVGWAMQRMGHVPVDRAAPAAAYLHSRRLLRAGEALGVFPEAGISWSYAVRPLMRGVAALARDTGAPVVPVALWGGQRIWSVGRTPSGREPRPSLRRGRLVDVRFGRFRGAFRRARLLVLVPFLAHHLALVGGQLFEFAVLLPRGLTLRRRQARPFAHALLKPRLRLGLHLGVALREAEPLALARWIELVPLALNRGEDLALLRGELTPGGVLGLLGVRD